MIGNIFSGLILLFPIGIRLFLIKMTIFQILIQGRLKKSNLQTKKWQCYLEYSKQTVKPTTICGTLYTHQC